MQAAAACTELATRETGDPHVLAALVDRHCWVWGVFGFLFLIAGVVAFLLSGARGVAGGRVVIGAADPTRKPVFRGD